MTDINKTIIVGRLTAQAETKYISTGTAISKFSIAVNRSIKKNDAWEDEVSFFNCTLWGKRAESLNQYLTKGSQVGIEGELRQNRWQDKDGNNRSVVEIVVNNIQLLGGNKKQEDKPVERNTGIDKGEIPF